MIWTELQDSISRSYCGTVLMLDDEIRVRREDGIGLNPVFINAKVAFEKRGMLCDMRHIEDEFESPEKYYSLCQQLKRSDTVVVDWYLGPGKDKDKDASNAIKVLQELSNTGGFRFAVIQSKENPGMIVDSLRQEFGATFSHLEPEALSEVLEDGEVILSEDEESSAQASSAPSTYRLSDSLYVSVVEKQKGAQGIVDIPHFFVSGLKAAYPDHLHWVGFEFASRVREILPRILKTLPLGTDLALIFQSLLQEKNEVGEGLVECLADEIKELLRTKPLKSASDDFILGRLSADQAALDKMKAACDFAHTGRKKSKFEECFGAIEDTGEGGKKAAHKTLSRHIANALSPKPQDTNITQAHEGYGALREHYQAVTVERLFPGVVLRREALSQTRGDWLLCISPACDCVRGDKAREYLFVEGMSLKSAEGEESSSVQTCLRTDAGYVHVKWSSKWFKTINCSPVQVDGYVLFGRLREDYVRLLIQRVLGWQSRVGVNTSEFLRIQRESAKQAMEVAE